MPAPANAPRKRWVADHRSTDLQSVGLPVRSTDCSLWVFRSSRPESQKLRSGRPRAPRIVRGHTLVWAFGTGANRDANGVGEYPKPAEANRVGLAGGIRPPGQTDSLANVEMRCGGRNARRENRVFKKLATSRSHRVSVKQPKSDSASLHDTVSDDSLLNANRRGGSRLTATAEPVRYSELIRRCVLGSVHSLECRWRADEAPK